MRLRPTLALVPLVVLVPVLGCDEKKAAGGGAASSSAAAAAKAAESAIVAANASAAAAAASGTSAPAPATSASATTSMITGDAKDVVVTVKEPAKEPEKTVPATSGGSVTLFLPDFPGTVWSVGEADKSLGKAKEEVIPGFAPGTNGHQFKWATTGAAMKPGKHKAQLVNKKAGDKAAKPTSTFTLTIDLS